MPVGNAFDVGGNVQQLRRIRAVRPQRKRDAKSIRRRRTGLEAQPLFVSR